MTKQEYIKSKWEEAGFIWDEIKYIVNPVLGGLQLQHPSLKTSLTGYGEAYDKGLLKGYDFDGNGLKVWNKLLDGVEHNNGWIKIEEKGNPDKSGTYMVIHERWEDEVKMFFNGQHFIRDTIALSPTHWRPIVEIPKPLY